jgi:hypothetical protein
MRVASAAALLLLAVQPVFGDVVVGVEEGVSDASFSLPWDLGKNASNSPSEPWLYSAASVPMASEPKNLPSFKDQDQPAEITDEDWMEAMDWFRDALPVVLPTCALSADRLIYTGTVAHTVSGIACQNWLSDTVHKRKFSTFENNSLCRNPDNDPIGPWCYVRASTSRATRMPAHIPCKHLSLTRIYSPTYLILTDHECAGAVRVL